MAIEKKLVRVVDMVSLNCFRSLHGTGIGPLRTVFQSSAWGRRVGRCKDNAGAPGVILRTGSRTNRAAFHRFIIPAAIIF
jgi:hypothetical protein